MAAHAKSLLPLLLLVGVLSHLAASSSEEQVKVTFLVHQHLESPGELMIFADVYPMLNGRSMQFTRGDVWVLTVTLTKGVEYKYSVLVLPDGNSVQCMCPPKELSELTVPKDHPNSVYVEVVSGYECNLAKCTSKAQVTRMGSIRQLYGNIP